MVLPKARLASGSRRGDPAGMTPTAELNISDPETLLAAAPWNLDDTRRAEGLIDAPTMLAPEERRFYYWCAAHWAQDAGAVVDLGAYAGGSTARLAAGVAARGGTARVHAFDRFSSDEKTKKKVLYRQGIPPFEGRDIMPIARRHLSSWKDRITFHQGEVQQLGWDGSPIEILAVDIGKRASVLDEIAAQFYPHLIPGRSLLIQQDFLSWRLPWLSAQMTRLAECLKPVAVAPKDTVAFLCTAPITAEHLNRAAVAGLSDGELQSDIGKMAGRLSDWGLHGHFQKMRAALRANPGKRVAWRMRAPPR
jgi:hypothetical protein